MSKEMEDLRNSVNKIKDLITGEHDGIKIDDLNIDFIDDLDDNIKEYRDLKKYLELDKTKSILDDMKKELKKLEDLKNNFK